MKKIQICLDEETYKYLKVESKRRTEINQFKENLIKAIDETAGIWQYKTENVKKTIKNIKKESRIDNNLYLL